MADLISSFSSKPSLNILLIKRLLRSVSERFLFVLDKLSVILISLSNEIEVTRVGDVASYFMNFLR